MTQTFEISIHGEAVYNYTLFDQDDALFLVISETHEEDKIEVLSLRSFQTKVAALEYLILAFANNEYENKTKLFAKLLAQLLQNQELNTKKLYKLNYFASNYNVVFIDVWYKPNTNEKPTNIHAHEYQFCTDRLLVAFKSIFTICNDDEINYLIQSFSNNFTNERFNSLTQNN